MRKKKRTILFVGIDHKYIKNKLIKKQILTLTNKPKSVNSYCSLKPSNILKKFKKKLKILISYYYNIITHRSDLNYYYYIYKFSYLKTLAQKMKKSITYISKTHSLNMPIQKMGYSQVGRRSFLIRSFKGSNPFTPKKTHFKLFD